MLGVLEKTRRTDEEREAHYPDVRFVDSTWRDIAFTMLEVLEEHEEQFELVEKRFVIVERRFRARFHKRGKR